MSGGRLTPLQGRILRLLSALEPPWTLTGGAALVGFHLKHRTTKDLDLFWHERQQLGSLPQETQARLTAEGLEVTAVQTSPTFHRLRVKDGPEVCIVDLVAEPVSAVHRPQTVEIQGVSITVDSPQEILVNKLCTLLSRSEVRDLVDVRALLESGADLKGALADAPRKDAGFSPLVLAWVLRDLRPRPLAEAAGLSEAEAEDLDRFREKLISVLLEAGAPE
ncbi:MAG TPA: nucleotidyl transferase AbiEii/AbiGii toxin family protein [Thermoanaerobaculia bacterium]|nr:nucleotidyl transferase AbiEii/AbiGii toxin family protein [Thermoanaerobaculia bacterium]